MSFHFSYLLTFSPFIYYCLSIPINEWILIPKSTEPSPNPSSPKPLLRTWQHKVVSLATSLHQAVLCSETSPLHHLRKTATASRNKRWNLLLLSHTMHFLSFFLFSHFHNITVRARKDVQGTYIFTQDEWIRASGFALFSSLSRFEQLCLLWLIGGGGVLCVWLMMRLRYD